MSRERLGFGRLGVEQRRHKCIGQERERDKFEIETAVLTDELSMLRTCGL